MRLAHHRDSAWRKTLALKVVEDNLRGPARLEPSSKLTPIRHPKHQCRHAITLQAHRCVVKLARLYRMVHPGLTIPAPAQELL